MRITRRTLLGMLASTQVAATGCCTRTYQGAVAGLAMARMPAIRPLLEPRPRLGVADTHTGRIIDTHAHFFNAADVPVRGFIEECIGHSAPPVARRLLRALAPLADLLAARAPTASDEISWLRSLMDGTARLGIAEAQTSAQGALLGQRRTTAERVAETIRGTEFERLYRQAKAGGVSTQSQTGSLADEILSVVDESETPTSDQNVVVTSSAQVDADLADGVLGFLYYMLSFRSSNVSAYLTGFRNNEQSFGVDMVLASLVDFDYWLDCPPRSAQDDQVELHALLAAMHGEFLRPVVAYNPWTDIAQDGAGLARVVSAVQDKGFAGVKIYPPTGFMPAGNATTQVNSRKRRPNLKRLDEVLATFFDKCAELQIPVIAHANRSNGRDAAHDEFSSPTAWRALLKRYATTTSPIIDVGHLGGASASNTWTADFAKLMSDHPRVPFYGDLGYWDELMCAGTSDPTCEAAKSRLARVLAVPIGTSETVADRVMFGSDWLMLAQVKQWANYPAKLHASLSAVAPTEVVDKIFGGNAARCFTSRRVTV